ncbi:hypothetical protein [Phormidesmis priestleyi]|uniref:hypothetical protein n=1 Tax=Phormidesmis priestleyi TaxID=268141 RepID=UPI00083AC750|nr:hypothetical protein [Phormidesmis priestleyi]
MSDSNHLTNNITSAELAVPEQSEGILNDAPTLSSLIPKNLSHNKKAVIERLIALHLSQAT